MIWLGVRGLINARRPVKADDRPRSGGMYLRALAIATINPKSVAGYLAAFSQFVEPGVPIWTQMYVIMPTALSLTALSYCAYTAAGAGLGRTAFAAVMNVWLRRGLAICFVIYGILLGASATPSRA